MCLMNAVPPPQPLPASRESKYSHRTPSPAQRGRVGEGVCPATALTSRIDRHPKALDHRVRQQLPRHLFRGMPRTFRIALRQLQFDHLACPDLADIAKPQRVQSMPDRLALRVQHAWLQHHRHGGLHCISSGPFMSRTPASGRIPSRFATSWYASSTLPRSRRKRSLSIFSLVFESHSRQLSGLISSARTIRISSFSHSRPNSSLKSTSVMPTPRNSPVRKSLMRRVKWTIS